LLANAQAFDRYEFVTRVLGNTQDAQLQAQV
jgi:hypothetical protein